jgi:hypothetical protein
VKSNSHEAHYRIFYTSLCPFLPLTSNILLTTLLTKTLDVLFSSCKKPSFTPTQNDRNNINFKDKNMKHSEENGSIA